MLNELYNIADQLGLRWSEYVTQTKDEMLSALTTYREEHYGH